MSKRLDIERQKELEPQRLKRAKAAIKERGYVVTEVDPTHLQFKHRGKTVNYWPYSGWATGQTINDGRGLSNLIKQLKL